MNSSDVSKIAQALGANADTSVHGAERFIETCVPEQWKPRSISGGLWNDFQRKNYGVLQHGIWLDDFPHWIDDPTGVKRIRSIWNDIERDLRKELDNIAGANIQHDETRTTDRAPHLWQWSFVYEIERFSGMFTIWITPQVGRKALMIVSLVEFNGHDNIRSEARHAK